MAGRTAYFRRARHWLANRGLRGLVEELRYRAQLRLRGEIVPGQDDGQERPHPFDLRYGVDTGGLLWGEALPETASGQSAFWATGYYGISPSAFTAALDRLDIHWPAYSFVDIGCGKGRGLLLALRFPFRCVTGVELSPVLASAASENLRHFTAPWRQVQVPATVQQGDATTFPFPAGPLVLFLYHPFAAPVMRRFLKHLEAALQQGPREVILLYANPELASMVAAVPGAQWLWKDTFPLTEEEGAADRFGSYGEAFAAFRLCGSARP